MSIHIHDLNELRAAARAGAELRYLPFWGHTPKRPGVVDKAVLSQWYPAPFTVAGVRYPTAEHYMMAAKARLFGADELVAQILANPEPGAAKALGRQVPNFDETRWAAAREDIVLAGSRGKFGAHEALRTFLMATGTKILVEASPVDNLWGAGLAHNDPRLPQPDQWPGLNRLGFVLMRLRSEWAAS